MRSSALSVVEADLMFADEGTPHHQRAAADRVETHAVRIAFGNIAEHASVRADCGEAIVRPEARRVAWTLRGRRSRGAQSPRRQLHRLYAAAGTSAGHRRAAGGIEGVSCGGAGRARIGRADDRRGRSRRHASALHRTFHRHVQQRAGQGADGRFHRYGLSIASATARSATTGIWKTTSPFCSSSASCRNKSRNESRKERGV